MDELTLLRTVREEVAPPSDEALDAGRRALVERIGSRPAPRRSHRGLKRAGWITGGTVVALGVGATLVLTNVVGLAGWRGGADSAAAAQLDRAAAATITTSDPVVGPGQYLKVTTREVFSNVSGHDLDATFLEEEDGDLYVPADHADDWVWVRDPSTVAQTFGPASEEAAKKRPGHDAPVEIVRAAKGAFYNGRPTDWGFDKLPRDPQMLLNYIYRSTVGQGTSPDGEAFIFIADTLRMGVAPADLRAALYQAAAGIPGVTITDHTAVLDGRTGVAFGREDTTGFRQEIVIDPNTGQVIGERSIVTRDGGYVGVPKGTVIGSTAVTTSVVDSAPPGGTICGAAGHPINGRGSGACQMDQ